MLKELTAYTKVRHEEIARLLIESGDDELDINGNPIYDTKRKNKMDTVDYTYGHIFNAIDLPTLVVNKEWGREEIILREPYAVKIMTLKPGHQVSTHFHAKKQETFLLIQGVLVVEFFSPNGDKIKRVIDQPYKSITLSALTPHTFYCPDGQEEETVFIEASTIDDPSDNYRVSKSGPREATTDR